MSKTTMMHADFLLRFLYGKFCHRTSHITSYWPFHTHKRWNIAGTIMALWTCGSLLQHTAMIIIIIYVILGKRSVNWLFALAFIFLRWRGHIPLSLSRPPKTPPSCRRARAQRTGSAQCHRSGGRVHPVLPQAVRTQESRLIPPM